MTTSSRPKILFVLTSQKELGDTGKPTGWYLPEFSHPYNVLSPHASITVASPAGGEAPLDPASVEAYKEDKISVDFLKTEEKVYKDSQALSAFIGHASEYDAIFYVGGHGPMFDLVNDETSIKLIAEFYDAGKIVAAVCHGPVALLNVKLANGEYLLKGHKVTGLSNDEEDAMDMSKYMPLELETELVARTGGLYEKAGLWGVKVVVSGRVITGQNPQSAEKVGEELKKALGL